MMFYSKPPQTSDQEASLGLKSPAIQDKYVLMHTREHQPCGTAATCPLLCEC